MVGPGLGVEGHITFWHRAYLDEEKPHLPEESGTMSGNSGVGDQPIGAAILVRVHRIYPTFRPLRGQPLLKADLSSGHCFIEQLSID